MYEFLEHKYFAENHWQESKIGFWLVGSNGHKSKVAHGVKWSYRHMCKTTIFSKLNELGCQWFHLNHFQTPPVTGYLKCWAYGCQNGSKKGPK